MTDTALAGLRVLELADEKGAYCGKLLADMGADVVKIEPPGGEPQRLYPPFWGDEPGLERGLGFLYSNTGKKSLTLDLSTGEGKNTLRQWLRHADILLETWPPGHLAQLGFSYESLRQHNPGLIVCSISGFGQFGPHCLFKTSDLVACAMGGAMGVIGFADDPPVKLAGSQSYMMASTLAAIGSLVALRYRRQTGLGQQVDISLQEAMLSVSSICGVGKWLEDGIVAQRFGTGLFAAVPSGVYHCTDGSAYLIVNRPRHWQALAQWVHEETGNVEILDPMFEGPSSARQPYRELLDYFIGELSARFSVDDFYREGQRRHLAVTPLHTATSLVTDPHLLSRRFFVELDHPGQGPLLYPGAPYRLSRTPWRMAGPAPRLGEANEKLDALLQRWRQPRELCPSPPTDGLCERRSALAGLRVLEFTAGMAGPWIGRYLAWCGADVIKVESKDYPDVTRLYVPPREPELGIQGEMSPWFTDWNAGKRFVALDLLKPDGAALARRLVAESDIVIDNNANGVLEKLGLGFDRLRAIKAELILFSSTGYGKVGLDAGHISWGPNIETLSGLASLSGFAHRECTMTQFAYPDALSALSGLFAILCALEYRDRSGHGQTINLSQQEATIAAMGDVVMETLANQREPSACGNGSPASVLEGCYPCDGDDRWCVISLDTHEQWCVLCRALGAPESLQDVRFASGPGRLRYRIELDIAIGECTRCWEARELMDRLQDQGIAAGVVQHAQDQYLHDEHLRARGFFERVRHFKKGEVVAPGIPLVFSESPGATRDSGRAIGHDNRAVFCDLLGVDAARFRAYLDAGVIQQAN
jgi:crotonobetainyl-CoA:carnitine CoA-transferase CaiB-like acyl-CoA transferase